MFGLWVALAAVVAVEPPPLMKLDRELIQSDWLIPIEEIPAVAASGANLRWYQRSSWIAKGPAQEHRDVKFSRHTKAALDNARNISISVQALHSKKVIVWLHGLNPDYAEHDSGQSVEVAPDPNVVVERPDAPVGPVAFCKGHMSKRWFDLHAPSFGSQPENTCAGCPKSIDEGLAVVDKAVTAIMKKHNVDASQMIIAGFSQGGAMALHAGLHSQHHFAGIVAWGGYMADLRDPKWITDSSIPKPVIAMLHGDQDELVPVEWAHKAFEHLNSDKLGLTSVTLTLYDDNLDHIESTQVTQIVQKAQELMRDTFTIADQLHKEDN